MSAHSTPVVFPHCNSFDKMTEKHSDTQTRVRFNTSNVKWYQANKNDSENRAKQINEYKMENSAVRMRVHGEKRMCNSQLLLRIQLIFYRIKILNVLNLLNLVRWLGGCTVCWFCSRVRIPLFMLFYSFASFQSFHHSSSCSFTPDTRVKCTWIHEVYKRTFNIYDTCLLLDLMHYIMMRINQIYFITSYNRHLTIRNKNDGCFWNIERAGEENWMFSNVCYHWRFGLDACKLHLFVCLSVAFFPEHKKKQKWTDDFLQQGEKKSISITFTWWIRWLHARVRSSHTNKFKTNEFNMMMGNEYSTHLICKFRRMKRITTAAAAVVTMAVYWLE